jgi:long-chain fatty acid transport protein
LSARLLLRPLFATLLACAGLLSASPSRVMAGGFYLGDRGVRATGRAGALVAGADAPDALWYNPAGLAFAGRQLQLDATFVVPSLSFTRIDGGGETQPVVDGAGITLPIPGAFYSDDFGLDDWTFGVGVFTPTALLTEWPDSVVIDGQSEAAPQRYSLLSMAGTALAHVGAGAAWRPIPQLSLGLTTQLVTGAFRVRTTLSACDRAICTQPENPDYDGVTELSLAPLLGVTFGAGAIYDAGVVRIGASLLTPYTLSGEATLRVRLPSAAAFDGARVDGDRARTALDFPWILRAGVEVRPLAGLRIEAAVVGELWSRQQSLTITPQDIWLRDVLALGDYQIGAVSIPRAMRDTLSLRLGGEYVRGPVGVRAGVAYENGAFDDATLTPLTLDSDKVTLALGVSIEVTRGLFLDVSYQHFFLRDRAVRNSAVPQPNPIRPMPADPVYVGNGDYEMEVDTFGVGLRWALDTPSLTREEGISESDSETHASQGDTDSPTSPDESRNSADTAEPSANSRAHNTASPARVAPTETSPRGEEGGDAPSPRDTRRAPRNRTPRDTGRVDPNPYRVNPNPYRTPAVESPGRDEAPAANPYRPRRGRRPR